MSTEKLRILLNNLLVPMVLLVACQESQTEHLKQPRSTPRATASAVAEFEQSPQAPGFTLSSLGGAKQSLKDFQGKFVLLNFWATWCAPCIAEMPALERIHQTFKDQGLMVVSVNVDTEAALAQVRQMVEKKGISFPVLLDPTMQVTERYGLSGFPESFFLGPAGRRLSFYDPEKKIRSARIVGDRPWDSPVFIDAIRQLLKDHTS